MEQFIFLLILGALSVGKWIYDTVQQQKQEPPQEQKRQEPGSFEQLGPVRETPEEERVRRFMEALGLPTGETPPAPRPRRAPPVAGQPPLVSQAPPNRPREPEPPASRPVFETAAQKPSDEAPRRLRPSTSSFPRTPAAPPSPFSRPAHPPAAPATTAASLLEPAPAPAAAAPRPYQIRQRESGRALRHPLAQALNNRASLQQALVLRELLGPPKGLEGRA